MFQHNLKPDHWLRFVVALQEIWGATEFQAGAESSVEEKTQRYFAQLDGRGYDEIISLAGPAGEQTYRALVASMCSAVPRFVVAQPAIAMNSSKDVSFDMRYSPNSSANPAYR